MREQVGPSSDPRQEARRVLRRLKLLIYLSEATQREIEARAGLSRGYLSQLLNGHIELKLWHLLVVLRAIDSDPAEFFHRLYPPRRRRQLLALEQFQRGSRAMDRGLRLELARLYGFGIETVLDLRERLEVCEEALDEIAGRGKLAEL